MSRRPAGLAEIFGDPRVRVVAGDVTDRTAVAAAVRNAGTVVHLAHGGGGDWHEIERTMIGGARSVAECCLDADRRLIFASSIAALYLGDADAVATAATLPDPRPAERADYARGKIASETMLRDLAENDGLRLTVVRPGVVVGRGTSPFHSGIGLFNRETHCIGWNAGRNPLPLVLAEDVADAVARLLIDEGVAPASCNLVGDVRLDARTYVAALARATGRPLRYHPQSPSWIGLVEASKWAVKRIGGRRAARSTWRDLRSRGLVTAFDTTTEKEALGWRPETDPQRFLARAFAGSAP
jgi:nucleoside-diphosphate-sugar epimerase